MRRFKKQKELSYWEILDGMEKFTIVVMIATIGFFIYIIVK